MEPNTRDTPWPVRSVSRVIGERIDRIAPVWIEGQVASLDRRAGTSYVKLRDPAADVSLDLVVASALLAESPVSEGEQVVVHAKPQWYLRRGQVSFQVLEVRAVGLGALLARLERLRRTLQQEGLFDPARKRPLPFLPRVVGLVCGRESAAKHDVVENARRRWPAVRFDVREVAVQGPYAVTEVVDAIAALDRAPEVDVIVVARGGGDVQELLPFSDEALCRAVAAATTPVVSAIGHEADTPLLDLVADWRASTPTDAGKRVVPDVAEEQHRIARLRDTARRTLARRVDHGAEQVHALAHRARRVLAHRIEQDERDVAAALAHVTALSPKATLDRGYAIVQRPDGAVVRASAGVHAGDPLAVRLANGELDVSVVTARDTASR